MDIIENIYNLFLWFIAIGFLFSVSCIILWAFYQSMKDWLICHILKWKVPIKTGPNRFTYVWKDSDEHKRYQEMAESDEIN